MLPAYRDMLLRDMVDGLPWMGTLTIMMVLLVGMVLWNGERDSSFFDVSVCGVHESIPWWLSQGTSATGKTLSSGLMSVVRAKTSGEVIDRTGSFAL